MKFYLPGPAIWRTKEADIPVVVTANLGKANDGRVYVSIEGSKVGIPLDELIYITLNKV